MKLDEFICDSLSQIMTGLYIAQDKLKLGDKRIGFINPKWGSEKDHAVYTTEVAFDIAISVTEQNDTGGKVQLKVVAIGIEGGKEISIENSRVSRISFKVPVYFPHIEVIGALPIHSKITMPTNAE